MEKSIKTLKVCYSDLLAEYKRLIKTTMIDLKIMKNIKIIWTNMMKKYIILVLMISKMILHC